jgi:hypothetical protein
MLESDEQPRTRDYVAAKNRRDAVKKMISNHPTLSVLYRSGTNDDGKAGWINAIRDQREPVYRLLFYLDRLPIGREFRNREPFEILYGDFVDDSEPNFPRALFTTTGGVNLLRDDIPDVDFATAVITNSLEIVPLSMERDLRTEHLIRRGLAYVAAFDHERQGLRLLNLRDFYEVFVSKEKREIQVRNEERIIVGDTRFVQPFFLRYVVKSAEFDGENPSEAAGQMLEE